MDELSQQAFLNHIGGEWVACASGATAPNLNPADSADVVGRFQQSDATDGARAVAAAAAAFPAWRDTPISSAPPSCSALPNCWRTAPTAWRAN